MKKVILLLSLLTLSMSVFSQIPIKGDGLSGDDFENVATEIKKKVRDFQRSVGYLAGNEYNHKEKEGIRKSTLDWFIGAGERYPYTVPTRYGFDSTGWHNAVVMGSAPTKNNRGERKHEPMKDYLSRLINNSENPNYRYKKVVIEGAEVVTLDNLRKDGNGYIATAHYLQKFTGYRSADMVRAAYTDYTAKTITIFINITELEQYDGSIEYYAIIKLGDVDCDDVW